jgi:tetratricopeptide (TPR) repeat protein
MENQTPVAKVEWTSLKVLILGVICLLLGVALGALFHGPAQPAIVALPVAPQTLAGVPQMPPQMAAVMPPAAADPVFEKLKLDPDNFELLATAGNAEMKAGDPKSAADYYGRALKAKDDPDVRINLANAYYRTGDADQSLAELGKVLKLDPRNDKALYNTGVVRFIAKKDPKGAIATWQTLLKYHPDHPHKAQVLEMIKRAQKSSLKAQG